MEKASIIFALTLGLILFLGIEAAPRYRNRPYVVTRWYMMTGFSETPYTDCGGSATVQKVEVIPCGSDDICTLKIGSNATFNISFIPKSKASTLKAVVHGIVAGLPMPFHFPQENACLKSNISCPIVEGETYNYSVQLPVLSSYPRIKVTVKWELKDETGKDVVCVEVPSRLE